MTHPKFPYQNDPEDLRDYIFDMARNFFEFGMNEKKVKKAMLKLIEEVKSEWAEEQRMVYAFMYNPMIHESASAVMSLHRTKKGAEMAMAFHKAEQEIEYNELYDRLGKEAPGKFGSFEHWSVQEFKIQEP